MGLDMYLTKKTYVRNWDHMKLEPLLTEESDSDGDLYYRASW